jgi:hypothetical protein
MAGQPRRLFQNEMYPLEGQLMSIAQAIHYTLIDAVAEGVEGPEAAFQRPVS